MPSCQFLVWSLEVQYLGIFTCANASCFLVCPNGVQMKDTQGLVINQNAHRCCCFEYNAKTSHQFIAKSWKVNLRNLMGSNFVAQIIRWFEAIGIGSCPFFLVSTALFLRFPGPHGSYVGSRPPKDEFVQTWVYSNIVGGELYLPLPRTSPALLWAFQWTLYRQQ